MRSRIISTAALGTIAVLGLAGCTSTTGGGSGGSGDGDGETLNVWIMEGTNPDAQPFFDEVTTAFEEQTGATLNIEFVQWADAHDRFVTSIAGGTTPDVAETGNTWTAEFADAGGLAPLTDYVAGDGLDGDLVEGLVESGTLDGDLYGMPWYAGVRSIVYRADIFEELGLEAPTTWDEIVTAGETIKDAHPEMNAFAVPGAAEMTVYPWVWGAGGEVATESDGTWTSGLFSPEAREGISFWTGLQTQYAFSSAGATTWTEIDVLDSFAAGETAMAVMGSWTPASILEKAPDMEGKIAATPIPAKDGGIAKSVLGGSHLSMFETAKNKDLAWEFIKMMTTGEFAQKWADQSGYFPGQTSLLDAKLASEDPLDKAFATQFVDGGAALPVTPTFGAVQAKKTTNTAIQAILSGTASVDDALKAAADEMTSLLNDK